MKVILIRHFESVANKEKFYSGMMDVELIHPVTVERLYPECDFIYSSSLKRAKDTADIIFPNKKIHILDEFKEMDFGDWSGKKYDDLKDNIHFTQWIDSPMTVSVPNGETYEMFSHRVLQKLNELIENNPTETIAIVTHGGVISCILSELLIDEADFYEHIPKNGEFITLKFENKILKTIRKGDELI